MIYEFNNNKKFWGASENVRSKFYVLKLEI